MLSRAWLLAALAACGTRARNEPPPAMPESKASANAAAPPDAAPEPPDDDELEEAWSALAITGASWRAALGSIRVADRQAMAIHLLKQGSFECPGEDLQVGQCEQERVLRKPTEESSFWDPCLRRLLALWALDQIPDDPTTATELFATLVQLVKIPPPERQLGVKALAKMPTGYLTASALWEAKYAGNLELATSHSLDGFDAIDLRAAASEFHLDDAVLKLEPAEDPDIYRGAVTDSDLLPKTRLAAIRALVELSRGTVDPDQLDATREALHRGTAERDCTVAAASSAALAEIGGSEAGVPSGPYFTEQDVIRSACAALGSDTRGTPWKQVISKHGLGVVDHRIDPLRVDALWTQYPFAYDHDLDGAPDVPEADPDDDGDPASVLETKTKRWSRRFTLPYADELKLALPHCKGNVCKVPRTSVWFELEIEKERGTRLRLRRLTRHERVGSDC